MVKNIYALLVYKLFFCLLGFSAIVTEIATIVERGGFKPVNFFSYFTIEVNILVVVMFLLSALAIAAHKESRRLDALRGMSTTFILVVGIGFAILLAGLEGAVLTAVPWDNLVLHYIIPVAVLVDYLVDPPRTRLQLRQCLNWLVFPIAYVAYSLSRGALTGWYPYPFLDPDHNGYRAVAITILGLFALSVSLIWVITKLSGKSKNR